MAHTEQRHAQQLAKSDDSHVVLILALRGAFRQSAFAALAVATLLRGHRLPAV